MKRSDQPAGRYDYPDARNAPTPPARFGPSPTRRRASSSVIVAYAALFAGCNALDSGVRAPGQPAAGPGGADYRHASVSVEEYGSGADTYWLFFPAAPRPETAPFVVFLHGWTAMKPRLYRGWIDHLVRKGHIVVYPRYQASIFDSAGEMETAAARAVAAAWARVREDGRVRPVTERIAWIGHSLGGTLAVRLAATSPDLGLPPPAVILSVQPGTEDRFETSSVDRMPVETRILFVVGDEDRVVGETGVASLLIGLGHLPPENVEQAIMQSDRRPASPLVADHLSPLAAAGKFPPDSLDFFGYWKLADGLLGAAFRDENLDYAFGGTERQRFMGTLSTGEPIAPLIVERPLASQ